jgi:hypothetical protein
MAATSNGEFDENFSWRTYPIETVVCYALTATAAMRNLSRHAASTQELPRLLHDDFAIRPIAIRC